MGQAKNRGSYADRIANARARIQALMPQSIVCNNCKAELTELETLDVQSMQGIEAAFAASCPRCNHNTWAVKGHPDAVAALMMVLEDESGGEVQLGTVNEGGAR